MIALGDPSRMGSTGPVPSIRVAGIFQPPILRWNSLYVDYRSPDGGFRWAGWVRARGISTPLLTYAFRQTFGGKYVIFIDQTLSTQSNLTLTSTLVHEIRHYLDFLRYPSHFYQDTVQEERQVIDDTLTSSGERQRATESAEALEEPFRRFFLDQLENFYPYLLSRLEKRAFQEQVRYLKIDLHHSIDEVVSDIYSQSQRDFGASGTPLTAPYFVRNYFQELYENAR
jgi:hypothetical protein